MDEKNPKDFFNCAAGFYDSMISFHGAVKRRYELLRDILPNNELYIADLGSGTGVDTIAAFMLGHKAVSFDPSVSMLDELKSNAASYGFMPEIQASSIEDIPLQFVGRFNYSICLGNTLALIPPEHLVPSFKKMRSLLVDGGQCLIQVLNYKKILDAKERIINISHSGEETFVRFYDFYSEYLGFNVLRFKTASPLDREIITTRIYPYKSEEILQAAKTAGFEIQNCFGGLDKSDWAPDTSTDVVLLLHR